jgi:surface antigen
VKAQETRTIKYEIRAEGDDVLVADPVIAQRLYEEQIAKKALQKKWGTQYGNACSCVMKAKELTGYNKSVGYAMNWPINSTTPVVGGVVVTNESDYGHVAYILEVFSDSIKVVEGNFVHCEVTTRVIKLNDPIIKGFWQP